jgi:antitoxin component YwqK of YwqJK toxin-antitoxin module
MKGKWSMLRVAVFLFVLMVTAAGAPLQAQPEPNRRPGPFLIYGPVHTIRDERAMLTNENGKLVEGPKQLVMTMEYNEDGTKQNRAVFIPAGTLTFQTVETYDPDGRVLETTNYQRGVLNNRVVSNYDERKQLIEQVTYRRDGSVSDRIVFSRQGNLREIEAWAYDFQGNVISQIKNSGDPASRRSESTIVTPSGVARSEWSQTNNPDGGREFKTEGSNGEFKREVFANFKGGEERIVYNKDGSIKSQERFVHEFDSFKNVIKTTHLTANGGSSDFVPADITYRTITYFGKD